MVLRWVQQSQKRAHASGDAFTVKQLHVTSIPKSARTPESVLKMCGLHYTDITQSAACLLGVAAT